MRCLVIGATGYVGSRLVPELLKAGREVRCLARDPARLDPAPFRDRVDVVEGDVVSGAGVAAALEGVEIVRYLTDRMPVMVTPGWVGNRTQPISIADVLRYLVASAELPSEVNRSFDVGGPDVLTYWDMMQRYARIAGLPRRLALPVPLVPAALSAWWVGLMTPVSRQLAKPLIESLNHELICWEHDIRTQLPAPPGGLLDYEQSVRAALPRLPAGTDVADPTAAMASDVPGSGGASYAQRWDVACTASAARLWRVVESIGGQRGWHTVPFAFELRGWVDQLLGGVGAHRGRRDPTSLRVGEVLDSWHVEVVEPGRRLVLRTEMKMPGTAWLTFTVQTRSDGAGTLRQEVRFVPTGLAGHLYWWAQRPGHDIVFGVMARGITHAAEHGAEAADSRAEADSRAGTALAAAG